MFYWYLLCNPCHVYCIWVIQSKHESLSIAMINSCCAASLLPLFEFGNWNCSIYATFSVCFATGWTQRQTLLSITSLSYCIIWNGNRSLWTNWKSWHPYVAAPFDVSLYNQHRQTKLCCEKPSVGIDNNSEFHL